MIRVTQANKMLTSIAIRIDKGRLTYSDFDLTVLGDVDWSENILFNRQVISKGDCFDPIVKQRRGNIYV
jgi:hypothetical protein